jgi:PAS domain-containing protein
MSILSGVGLTEGGSTLPTVDGTEMVAGLSTALNSGGASDSNPLFEILDLAGDAFVVIDGSFRIVLFNRAAERVFQYEAAEIIGQSVQVLMPGQSGERVRDNGVRF